MKDPWDACPVPIWEDPLEQKMAAHSSILVWKIPWTEEPGGLQSMWPQRVRYDWVTTVNFLNPPFLHPSTLLSIHSTALKGNPFKVESRFSQPFSPNLAVTLPFTQSRSWCCHSSLKDATWSSYFLSSLLCHLLFSISFISLNHMGFLTVLFCFFFFNASAPYWQCALYLFHQPVSFPFRCLSS